jgi:type I restriction enzyme S subunit
MSELSVKEGWPRVAFGDVVQLVRARSADPEGDGFDRYVGLEHIDPGDLKIRRWGDIANGTTFTNIFRAGQVLFGKRRAYQRKVAVADFDGVCSGDIYVLEPKDAKLLPELLLFICQSDGFFEHAVGTSAGSLSPRTNWESLASYEFSLPPQQEQRRVAAVMQVAQAYGEALYRLSIEGKALLRSFVEREVGGKGQSALSFIAFRSRWPIVALGDICDISSGKKDSNEAVVDGKYPFFTCGPTPLRSNVFSFDCEALLLPGNNASGVYKPQYYKGRFEARQRVYVITLRDTSHVAYLYLYLALERGLSYLQARSVGSAAKFITLSDLQSVPVPLPPIAIQSDIVQRIEQVKGGISQTAERIDQTKRLLAGAMQESARVMRT